MPLVKEDLDKALAYVEKYWENLHYLQTEDSGTLIGLPHPYITPSVQPIDGFVYREMYYWDSYFVVKAFINQGKIDEARGIVDNLLLLVERFGMVPNANRFYMLSRSQPPILSAVVHDVFEKTGDKDWLAWATPLLIREHTEVWMGSQQPHIRQVYAGLSRYYDINSLHELAEAESGWDFTPRFDNRCLDFIPIDLNAHLWLYEHNIAHFLSVLDDQERSMRWQQRAEARKVAVNTYLWDEESGFFFDYDYINETPSTVLSLAAFMPMCVGMATEEQAAELVKSLDLFETEYGLSTTPPAHGRYEVKQWAAPNGWAPLQYIVVLGLRRYGYEERAQQIIQKWLALNTDVFLETGEFYEKYNVVEGNEYALDGVYPGQVGFSWTNAVFAEFARLYKQ